MIHRLVILLAGIAAVAPVAAADTEAPPMQCLADANGARQFTCRIAPIGPDTTYRLEHAPAGMAVQPRSGFLHWTPGPDQQGSFVVDIVRMRGSEERRDAHTFTVTATLPAPAGIFVSPDGDDGHPGTLAQPLASVQKAADRARPGDVIYLRGGRYVNEGNGTDFGNRRRDSLARITTSGDASGWITLRPWVNEYATLASDVNGLVFKDAHYWRLQGLDLEGTAPGIDSGTALTLWWNTTAAANRIDGRGIALNTSSDIEIERCVVHDFSGAGISNNGGAYITLADSVVYGNGAWTTAGTHGFANSKPQTGDNGDTTSIKLTMRNNLVFGNQSSMISHVFDKHVVKLDIDEGNGLHMQNTEGDFVGRFLVEQNLVLYNGKAGLGLNTVDHGIVRNNGFYANAQAVDDAGELVLQSAASDSIAGNLFHALPARRTIKDSTDSYAGVGINYAVPSADAADLPPQVAQLASVFRNPAQNDFRPVAQIPAGNGVPAAVLDEFAARRTEYGLVPAPASTAVTPAYVQGLRNAIVATWPVPAAGDGIPADLVLVDPVTGYCYRYADRNDYPGPPSSGTTCPAGETVRAVRRPMPVSMPSQPAVVEIPSEPAISSVAQESTAPTQLSQMADNTPGTTGTACGQAGASTASTSWWRRFYFNEHPGIGTSVAIESVTVTSGGSGVTTMPVSVNLYTVPHGDAVDTIAPANLTPIGSGNGVLSGNFTASNVAVAAMVADTAASDLVVEFRAAGNATGGSFLPGANASAETHPTFVTAADCGVLLPTPAAALGFGDLHLNLTVQTGPTDRIFANGFESGGN